jgi:hypothetical protein
LEIRFGKAFSRPVQVGESPYIKAKEVKRARARLFSQSRIIKTQMQEDFFNEERYMLFSKKIISTIRRRERPIRLVDE